MLVGSSQEQRQERLSQYKLTDSNLGRSDDSVAYAGVQLRICARPCQSAVQMQGQSFLKDAAPGLPLAGCDRTCLCSLETCDDRRASADRRLPDEDVIVFAEDATVDNSRKGRDRRRRRTTNPYVELSR